MPLVFRSWTDHDAGSDREISQAIYPEYREDPDHPAWFPAQQLGAPPEHLFRYLVLDSENHRPLAYATLWELRPHRHRFDLAVRPDWQRQGIGTRLLSQVIDHSRSLGATGLQARVRDDKIHALDFIRRYGFQESHRMGAYRLDFTTGIVCNASEALARLNRQGIEVVSLAVLRKEDSQYLERFYELHSAARLGWPDPDPDPRGASAISFAIVKRWLDEANRPEMFFIARHKQQYVAFTSFFDVGTAVHPEYRRRGIATSLKALSIADGQQRGFRGQTTSTASPGMQAVLEKLGFRRTWSEVRLIRQMRNHL